MNVFDRIEALPVDQWPASRIVHKLGGADRVAPILGIDRSVVYRWSRRKSAGGTGGLVPAHHQVALMAWSAANGGPLEHADFFPPESVYTDGDGADRGPADDRADAARADP